MGKGHKKKGSKFPIWSCIIAGLMIICGIIAGIGLNLYLGFANPEGLGEIFGTMVGGYSGLAMMILFGSAGFILFIILIFIWGR
jgi:hypothetical protein